MTPAFVGAWIFSITDQSAQAQKERVDFIAQSVRCKTGIGAAGSSGH